MFQLLNQYHNLVIRRWLQWKSLRLIWQLCINVHYTTEVKRRELGGIKPCPEERHLTLSSRRAKSAPERAHRILNARPITSWPTCRKVRWEKAAISLWGDSKLIPIYHFTPVRMAIIKKSANNKWQRRCMLLVGEGNGNPFQYVCLENPMEWGSW